MTMSWKQWTFACAVAVCAWSVAPHAWAATFRVTQDPADIGVGDTVRVLVALDEGDDNVNAVQGTLTYDPAVLTFVRANTAQSAVNLWTENPTAVEHPDGRISFAGVTPGGFGDMVTAPKDGVPATVMFVAEFTAQRATETTVTVESTHAYRNDGEGTEVGTDVAPLALRVQTAAQGGAATEADTVAPAPFTVTIGKDARAFDGKRFAMFMTTDKQSGVASYMVSENGSAFVAAQSPYVLRDQRGFVWLRVRAVDGAGNVTSATTVVWWSAWTVVVGCILALCGAVCARILWRRRRA